MMSLRLRAPIVSLALLLALCVVPAAAGIARLANLMAGHASPESARFFAHPWPVTLHILSVVPYSTLGATQFVPAFRRHRWHRVAGALAVPLGLSGALTGLWMAQVYPWPAGDGEAVYLERLLVGTVMAVAIIRGAWALRQHEYSAHGAWMTRGYALGMGAGTQVLTHLPWFVFIGTPGESARAVLMGLGWAINYALAESLIRRQRVKVASGSRIASVGAFPTPAT